MMNVMDCLCVVASILLLQVHVTTAAKRDKNLYCSGELHCIVYVCMTATPIHLLTTTDPSGV